jgi:hypothetical protein
MPNPCPYCGIRETQKDANGFCKKYGCAERHKEEMGKQENHLFAIHPIAYKIKRVITTETYNYGKLVKTETTYS